MFKLIVAGSRDFNDYKFLSEKLDHLLKNITDSIEIVCGKAKGADTLGEEYAKEKGYAIKYFPADWDKHGRSAGPIRNGEMGRYANACVVFWKNNSRGSENMIDVARIYKLKLRVYKV